MEKEQPEARMCPECGHGMAAIVGKKQEIFYYECQNCGYKEPV